MPSRLESVETPDGSFDLTVWLPAEGAGPGLLLIQEIYGVSDYIRAVAEDLAALGYVVAAPDLFWRLQPGYQAAHDDAGLAASLEMGSRFDVARGVADSVAALGVLAGLPQVDGGIGIIGFCLGGSIAYLVAAQTPARQQPRRAVGDRDLRMIEQLDAGAVGIDLNAIADRETPQRLDRKIDQHGIDAAVLAGDDAGASRARAGHDPRRVAYAGERLQSQIGAVALALDRAPLVADRGARLDVVAGEADARIADPVRQHDAAGAREHAGHAVLADAIRRARHERRRDLAEHGDHHQFAGVDPGRARRSQGDDR